MTSPLVKETYTIFATHIALVVKDIIANNNVHRMLVDNGSFIDILYYQAF